MAVAGLVAAAVAEWVVVGGMSGGFGGMSGGGGGGMARMGARNSMGQGGGSGFGGMGGLGGEPPARMGRGRMGAAAGRGMQNGGSGGGMAQRNGLAGARTDTVDHRNCPWKLFVGQVRFFLHIRLSSALWQRARAQHRTSSNAAAAVRQRCEAVATQMPAIVSGYCRGTGMFTLN